jgi:hypothetical protein
MHISAVCIASLQMFVDKMNIQVVSALSRSLSSSRALNKRTAVEREFSLSLHGLQLQMEYIAPNFSMLTPTWALNGIGADMRKVSSPVSATS